MVKEKLTVILNHIYNTVFKFVFLFPNSKAFENCILKQYYTL